MHSLAQGLEAMFVGGAEVQFFGGDFLEEGSGFRRPTVLEGRIRQTELFAGLALRLEGQGIGGNSPLQLPPFLWCQIVGTALRFPVKSSSLIVIAEPFC